MRNRLFLVAPILLLAGWGSYELLSLSPSPLQGKVKPLKVLSAQSLEDSEEAEIEFAALKKDNIELSAKEVQITSPERLAQRRKKVADLPALRIQASGAPGLKVRLFALPVSKSLAEQVRKEPFVHPADLLEDNPPIEFSGELPFALPGDSLEAGEHFVWVEAQGFFVESQWIDWPLLENEELVLERASVSSVQVVGPNKEPIPGLDVFFYDTRAEPEFLDWPWQERLERCLFIEKTRTDANGVARLLSPSRNGNAVEVEAALGRSGATIDFLEPGSFEVAVVQPSFAVRGKILDAKRQPVHAANVWFVTSQNGETIAVESATANSDGEFFAEAVPASSGSVEAIVVADGFALESQSLSWPKAGNEYSLDFLLAKAVSLRGRVYSGDTPLEGVEITFARDTYRWIPGTWMAEKDGGIEVEETFFEPGKPYLVSAWSDNFLLGTLPFVAPESGEEAVWSFPAMGNLSPKWRESEDSPVRFEFQSRVGSARGTCEWSAEQSSSPWLPIGPGVLTAIFESGNSCQLPVNVPPLPNHEVQLDFILTTVSFEIPISPAMSGEWVVEDLVGSAKVGAKKSLHPGRHTLDVFPGSHNFFFHPPSGPSFRIGPVKVTDSGFDLGSVSAPLGTLFAEVQGPDSEPVAEMEGILFDSKGESVGWGASDENGQLVFEGLFPGNHTLTLRPNQSALHHFPDRSQTVWVGADAPTFLKVQLPQSTGLECRVLPAPESETIAIGLRAGVLEDQRMPGDGVFHLGWNEGGIVAAVLGAEGRLALSCSWVEPGETTVTVLWPGEMEQKLSFVHADGTPLSHAKVTPILNGTQLPVSASLDSSGSMLLSCGNSAPLEFLVEHADGRRQSYLLGDFQGGTDIFFGAELSELLVVDYSGVPIPRAGVWSRAARSLSLTDAQGHCRVQTGLGVRVERGGFWPMEASSSQKRVVMRRRLEGRVVHWQGSMAPTHISLAPLFRLGVEISVVATPLKKGTWALSSLPEGTYSLLGRNSQGEVVSETTIALSPLAGAEVYFSAKR